MKKKIITFLVAQDVFELNVRRGPEISLEQPNLAAIPFPILD